MTEKNIMTFRRLQLPASFAFLALAVCLVSCLPSVRGQGEDAARRAGIPVPDESRIPDSAAVATFAGGCFWCVEECFMQKPGVLAVISGYAQGSKENAVYKKVSNGLTDHTEAVEVHYDPNKVSFGELVEHFWKIHDPTTLNRQGNDIGRQYRSGIYYRTEEEKEIALASKAALDASGRYGKPVVSEILSRSTFFAAEDYHQNYYRRNPGDRYCLAVLVPKLKKLGLVWVEEF